MAQFEWVHAAWLALAIVLEIVANVFLKFSRLLWQHPQEKYRPRGGPKPGGGAGCL